jgi:queuine tRNA-ribosyltransferase
MLGAILLTMVNLAYYQELMAGIRAAITVGNFTDFCAQTREGWARGDVAPAQGI